MDAMDGVWNLDTISSETVILKILLHKNPKTLKFPSSQLNRLEINIRRTQSADFFNTL